MDVLDKRNVQSIILKPYQYAIARHFFFNVGDRDEGRKFLSEWLPSITRGEQNPAGTDNLMNLSVSWTGLKALGAFEIMGGDTAAESAFYIFNEPPDPGSLKIAGASAPANWWNKRFDGANIHLVVHVYVRTENELSDVTKRLRSSAQRGGLKELLFCKDNEAITGRAFDGRRLHFGYEDGISHPAVNWDDDPNLKDHLPRGDFLLGYPTPNHSTYPNKPPFSDFVRDGSLVAFMLMHQDVAGFNDFLRANGPRAAPALSQSESEEYLAAKMMGRWRDGTPLALSTERSDPTKAMDDDFGYANDPLGLKCPVSAHIRIANARDQPLNSLNQTLFPGGVPRVLRRGTPYGPPLEGLVDDGVDRGIVGMFFCANLNRQFYTLTRWLGRTDFSPLLKDPVGQDPIVGDLSFQGASPTFSFPRDDGTEVLLARITSFVETKGVAFLLMPSIATLKKLADPQQGVPSHGQ